MNYPQRIQAATERVSATPLQPLLLDKARQRVEGAIPLSLYRRSMRGIALDNPHLYDEIFSKYGAGPDRKIKQRVYLPVGSSPAQLMDTTQKPNAKVLEYLAENKYVLDNYLLGTVIMPDGKRTTKIGKILSDQPELKKLFDNDPARRSARNLREGEMLTVISRHPYDILGISFDRGWTSCTNLKGGEEAQSLRSSIRYGLLAAYLVKATDKNINTPLARILVRPYFNKQGEVVLVPDDEEYGGAPGSFRKVVEKFCYWASADSPRGKYSAPRGMYLDQAEYDFFHLLRYEDVQSPDEVDRIRSPDELKIAYESHLRGGSADSGYSEEEWRAAVLLNPRTPVEILERGMAENRLSLDESLAKNPRTPESFIATLCQRADLGEKSFDFVRYLATRELPWELLSSLPRSHFTVTQQMAGRPELTPEMMLEIAQGENWLAQTRVASREDATPEVLNLFIKMEDIAFAACTNPNLPPEGVAVALQSRDQSVRDRASRHRNYKEALDILRKQGITPKR